MRCQFYDALAKQFPQLSPSGQDDETQALHARAFITWYVASAIKTAQWRCELEQVVRTGEGAFHRADLVATAPDGALWAIDVSITAAWRGDTVHAHLECAAASKASRYTPGGARHEGLAFLQQVLARIAAAEGVDDWKPHVSQSTQQHPRTPCTSHASSHWQMHMAGSCM